MIYAKARFHDSWFDLLQWIWDTFYCNSKIFIIVQALTIYQWKKWWDQSKFKFETNNETLTETSQFVYRRAENIMEVGKGLNGSGTSIFSFSRNVF